MILSLISYNVKSDFIVTILVDIGQTYDITHNFIKFNILVIE